MNTQSTIQSKPVTVSRNRSHCGVVCGTLTVVMTAAWVSAAPIEVTLRYPAGDQQTPQPTAMCVDSRGDVFVADAPGNRIVIFNAEGQYEFEFSTAQWVIGPQQIAADSNGRIFVHGYSTEHTLAVFDFNGDFLNYLDMYCPGTDSLIETASFTLYKEDQLMFLCARPAHIFVYGVNGDFTRDFPLLQELDDATREGAVLGNVSVINDLLVVPLSMNGQVARYSLAGNFVDLFGMAGGGPRELSFPIASVSDGRTGMLVLDKHRHTVLHYDHTGKYLDEFGGSGKSEGWFYHPTVMVPFGEGKCLVGQTFQNRIQLVDVFGKLNPDSAGL